MTRLPTQTLLFAATATVSAAETVEIDAPGILDKPHTTYILTRDVTAERTAFMVKGNHITLDLGGHTITYGTAIGLDRCSGVFLRPGGGEDSFKGVPKEGFGGGNHFTLRNGRIVQGPQPLATKLKMRSGRILKAEGSRPGRSCFAVYVRACDGLEITGVTTEVNSRDSDNLYIRNCSNVRVHHNHCLSTVREITNRHYPGTGVITIANVYGPIEIDHNVIDGGGQWGIRVAGGRGFTGHLVEVHHNIVRHRSYTTNGYGIGAAAANMRIYANVVKPAAGRGVHLTGTNMDFHNNIVDAREKPNPEYPRTRTHGIKLEGCRYTQVHHNFSRVIAAKGFGDAAPLDFTVPRHSTNRVYKNTIVARREPDATDFWAASLNLYVAEAQSFTQVYDNVFRTNHWHLRSDWSGARDFEFVGNRFELIGSPEDYHVWFFSQNSRAASRDLVFRDSVLIDGADLRKIHPLHPRIPKTGIDVRIEWTVKVSVADLAGKGVRGADIAAYEGEAPVASASTDEEGEASLVLLGHRIVGDRENPVEEHGPHALVVSRGGREVKRLTVDPKETMGLMLTVAEPGRKLYVYAGEDQRQKIGETATLTGTVKAVGAGEPQIRWRQVGGPQQLPIADPSSANARVTMAAWGVYTFEIEAKLGDEIAKDQVRVRADATLTPQAVAHAPKTAMVNTIVQLDATKSTDPRRFPSDQVKYVWKQVSGPEAILSSNEWPDPIFYPTEPGTYVFELAVSNPIRMSQPAQCSVTVTAPEGEPQ